MANNTAYIKINLLDNKSIYFSGDTIKGNVEVDVIAPFMTRSLNIQLNGTIMTVVGNNNQFFDPIQQEVYNLLGVKDFRSLPKKDIAVNQLNPHKGTHIFPFEFKLPQTMIPTQKPLVGFGGAKVEYELQSSLFNKENRLMMISKLPIKIGGFNEDRITLKQELSPESAFSHKDSKKFKLQEGFLNVDINFPFKALVKGQKVNLMAMIDNKSQQEVKGVEVSFIYVLHFGQRGSRNSRKKQDKLSKVDVDIRKDEKKEVMIDFSVPSNSLYNLDAVYMEVEIFFKLRVILSSMFSTDVRMKFPVRILPKHLDSHKESTNGENKGRKELLQSTLYVINEPVKKKEHHPNLNHNHNNSPFFHSEPMMNPNMMMNPNNMNTNMSMSPSMNNHNNMNNNMNNMNNMNNNMNNMNNNMNNMNNNMNNMNNVNMNNNMNHNHNMNTIHAQSNPILFQPNSNPYMNNPNNFGSLRSNTLENNHNNNHNNFGTVRVNNSGNHNFGTVRPMSHNFSNSGPLPNPFQMNPNNPNNNLSNSNPNYPPPNNISPNYPPSNNINPNYPPPNSDNTNNMNNINPNYPTSNNNNIINPNYPPPNSDNQIKMENLTISENEEDYQKIYPQPHMPRESIMGDFLHNFYNEQNPNGNEGNVVVPFNPNASPIPPSQGDVIPFNPLSIDQNLLMNDTLPVIDDGPPPYIDDLTSSSSNNPPPSYESGLINNNIGNNNMNNNNMINNNMNNNINNNNMSPNFNNNNGLIPQNGMQNNNGMPHQMMMQNNGMMMPNNGMMMQNNNGMNNGMMMQNNGMMPNNGMMVPNNQVVQLDNNNVVMDGKVLQKVEQPVFNYEKAKFPNSKIPKSIVWQVDSECKGCNLCKKKINFFNQANHCRACGKIVDRKCNKKVFVKEFNVKCKVCTSCQKEQLKY